MEFIKEYPVEKLQVWEKNPRKNDTAAEKLKGIIQEYGFINPIIIDQHGTIRAGHTRLKAALELKRAHVPVLIHDFENEAQAIGFAIADNKTSEWAEWDFEQLDELMKELDDADFDTELTGFDDHESNEDFSEKNQEIDIDSFDDEMKLTFKLNSEQYDFVIQRLNNIDEEQNKALLKVLGYEI